MVAAKSIAMAAKGKEVHVITRPARLLQPNLNYIGKDWINHMMASTATTKGQRRTEEAIQWITDDTVLCFHFFFRKD